MRRMWSTYVLVFGLLFCLGTNLAAQDTQAWEDFSVPPLSTEAQISVVTMWPGNPIYLAFGHSAFRVQDPVQDIDLMFNYGTFNLNDPGFIPRFIYGDLRYLLSVSDFGRQLDWDLYSEARRWEEQVLALTQTQIQRLFTFLVWNAQPEHRTYRYDFVLDNCSTRVLDALELIFGDDFYHGSDEMLTGANTARQLIDSHVETRPWYRLGFSLVLGRVVDAPLSLRDAYFMPFWLKTILDKSTIAGPEGFRLLVANTLPVIDLPPESSTLSWYTYPLPWMLGLCMLALAWFGLGVTQFLGIPQKKHAVVRSTFPGWRLMQSLVYLTQGMVGIVVWYMSLFSVHFATKQNIHVLWLSPLVLLGLGLVWIKQGKQAGKFRRICAIILVVLHLVALFGVLVGFQAMDPAALVLLLSITLFHAGKLSRILGARP